MGREYKPVLKKFKAGLGTEHWGVTLITYLFRHTFSGGGLRSYFLNCKCFPALPDILST
jgi:hypothetical protein